MDGLPEVQISVYILDNQADLSKSGKKATWDRKSCKVKNFKDKTFLLLLCSIMSIVLPLPSLKDTSDCYKHKKCRYWLNKLLQGTNPFCFFTSM
jgi:hypothetical protein